MFFFLWNTFFDRLTFCAKTGGGKFYGNICWNLKNWNISKLEKAPPPHFCPVIFSTKKCLSHSLSSVTAFVTCLNKFFPFLTVFTKVCALFGECLRTPHPSPILDIVSEMEGRGGEVDLMFLAFFLKALRLLSL